MRGDLEHISEDRVPERLRQMRKQRGWTLDNLAARSGVSRAMISKIELGTSNPTAKVLGRLTSALGVTLSSLLAEERAVASRKPYRAADQPVWKDPDTGYLRRQLTLKEPGAGPELVFIELPADVSIEFPDASESGTCHAIWVLDGELAVTHAGTRHQLRTGDSLNLGIPDVCSFATLTGSGCSYVIAIGRA